MSESNSDLDGFEEAAPSTMWNPRSSGSKASGDFKELVSGTKSWIAGYYLGNKDNQGKHGSTVHTIRLRKDQNGNYMIGDAAHLSKSPEGDTVDVNIWGSGMLNGEIAENVTAGTMILIMWEGLKPKKKDPSATYHSWKLKIKKTDTIDLMAGVSDDELDAEFNESVNPVAEHAAENKAMADSPDPLGDEDGDEDF
jgi:hypothetical protein